MPKQNDLDEDDEPDLQAVEENSKDCNENLEKIDDEIMQKKNIVDGIMPEA